MESFCPACLLQKVGCDYVVESSAVEDRCGVCNGDGSTCTTVRRTFEETEGLGTFLTAFSALMTINCMYLKHMYVTQVGVKTVERRGFGLKIMSSEIC